MSTAVRRVALVAWIVFAVLTVGSLLAGFIFPAWITLLLILPAILAWGVLLVVYHRWLGQWRGVLLVWLAFGILRAAVTWQGAGDGVLRGTVASLLALLCFYAWMAGYAALIALVIHRDVSVAYIFIPIAIGALVMLLTVRSVGGVTQWFDALTSATTVARSFLLEPLLLSLSCMGMLGFIAVVPYMIITGVREVRGN
jgi:hypothetical protein